MKNRYLLMILIVLSFISLSLGSSKVTLLNIFNNIDESSIIFIVSRIPRLMGLIIASISLSISGLIFQQLSRNKFVSPTTASTLDGAKFGLTISYAFFATTSVFTKMIFSFIFSLISTFIFMGIIKKIRSKGSVYIPLIGIMLGAFLNAMTTFIAYNYDLIQIVTAWFYGDFSKVIQGRYELLYLAVPVIIITYIYINKFAVISMGKDFSSNLGVNYDRFVNLGLVIVCLLSSITVIIVGSVPFVGLIIPNIVSAYMGDNLKKNIVTVSLLAPIFLLVSDILGRIIKYPYELPLSLISGVLGSVFFLHFILKEQK